MTFSGPDVPRAFLGEKSLSDQDANIHVALTYDVLDASTHINRVKSPKAGAIVLFAGCTRDSFASQTVTHLAYTTYAPLALRSLSTIAHEVQAEHGCIGVAITHRLGRVDVGEESILIVVSAPHRQAGWRAGEDCLEKVKSRVEIWKEEWFEDGGVWRANRDGKAGVPVIRSAATEALGERVADERPTPSKAEQ